MFSRLLSNILPGLLVATVPFSGWSLFNVGKSFAFTSSYIIGLVAVLLGLYKLLRSPILVGGLNFIQLYAPLVSTILFSFLPMLFWDYADVDKYFASLLHLIFFLAVTWSLLQIQRPTMALVFYGRAYTIIALIVSAIGLYDFVLTVLFGAGLEINFNTIAREAPSVSTIAGMPRASSVFYEPGWFAHYILIDIILVVTWLLPVAVLSKKFFDVCFFRAVLLIMLVALAATLSASGYLVSAFVFLFYIINGHRPVRSIVLIVITLALLSLLELPNEIPNPLVTTFDRVIGLFNDTPVEGESADTRSEEVRGGVEMFLSTWMLGAGFGQSVRYIETVIQTGTGGISSYYVMLLAETGLIGFCAFSLSVIALNYKLWRLHKAVPYQDIVMSKLVFCCRCVVFAETLFLNFFSAMSSPVYVCSFWFALLLLSTRITTQKHLFPANRYFSNKNL